MSSSHPRPALRASLPLARCLRCLRSPQCARRLLLAPPLSALVRLPAAATASSPLSALRSPLPAPVALSHRIAVNRL